MATLTATYDPAYHRIGLQVDGFTDGVPVTIKRDGAPVRGGVDISPSSGSYFVWDYEAPFNVEVVYTASDGTLSASASATIPVRDAWLRAPGLPSLDMPVLPREVPVISTQRPSATLRPLGRRRPVVLSTTRQAGEFTLSLWTRTSSEAAALQSLVDEAAVVLLLMPGARGVERVYVALGDVDAAPVAGHIAPTTAESWTLWSLGATVVDSPIGSVFGDPTASYQALLDNAATYQGVIDTHDTYLSVLRGA